MKILAVSSSLLIPACVADSGADDLTPVSDDSAAIHMQLLYGGDKVLDSAPPGAHLTDFGGPILKNVHVAPLYWNSGVQFQSTLNPFYNDVPNSPLYTMLSQYRAIGHGNGQAGFVDSRSTANVSDRTVQTEVLNQINAGHLPAPTANTYYPVHFPPNMSITSPDGSRSCVVFCAYHGTFRVQTSSGQIINVNYGVVPDQGGGCAGGCGANPSRVNNLTSVASHELIEATTDPAVGLATVIGPPLAWYDPNNGEIGDICNGQQGTTTGNGHTYTIQLEFSNAANNCVAQ
ncbi:MAG TPA: hypothetical protein VFK02_19305 [Kofleriaceae bacterium]|nr:hypothetical protein [Kofleriaceae bacterium]